MCIRDRDFNPQTAIDEIGTTAKMVFRKGSSATGEEILSGDDVEMCIRDRAYTESEVYAMHVVVVRCPRAFRWLLRAAFKV